MSFMYRSQVYSLMSFSKCLTNIYTHITHTAIKTEHFQHPRGFSCIAHLPVLHTHRQPLFWFYHYINAIILYAFFCVWLLSCNMFLRFIHSIICMSSLLFTLGELIYILSMDPTGGHLGYLRLGGIMNKALKNIHVQVLEWPSVFISLS